jgi:hypothetical protein
MVRQARDELEGRVDRAVVAAVHVVHGAETGLHELARVRDRVEENAVRPRRRLEALVGKVVARLLPPVGGRKVQRALLEERKDVELQHLLAQLVEQHQLAPVLLLDQRERVVPLARHAVVEVAHPDHVVERVQQVALVADLEAAAQFAQDLEEVLAPLPQPLLARRQVAVDKAEMRVVEVETVCGSVCHMTRK